MVEREKRLKILIAAFKKLEGLERQGRLTPVWESYLRVLRVELKRTLGKKYFQNLDKLKELEKQAGGLKKTEIKDRFLTWNKSLRQQSESELGRFGVSPLELAGIEAWYGLEKEQAKRRVQSSIARHKRKLQRRLR